MAALVATGVGSFEVRAQESVLTPEEKAKVEEVVGMSYTEIERQFTVSMPHQPQNGAGYIVHLGQTHKAKDTLVNLIYSGKISNAQEKIEFILTSLIKSNQLQCVFSEGLTAHESDVHDPPSDFTELKRNVNRRMDSVTKALQLSLGTPEEIEKAMEVLTDYASVPSGSFIYHYAHDKYLALASKLSQAAVETQGVNEATKKRISSIIALVESSGFSNVIQEGGGPNPYFRGADFKIMIEEKVPYLCPTETEEANSAAFARRDEAGEARSRLSDVRSEVWNRIESSPDFQVVTERLNARNDIFKGRRPTEEEYFMEHIQVRQPLRDLLALEDTNPEVVEASEELKVREKKEKEAVFGTRENIALGFIERYQNIASGRQDGNVVIVYGSNHDFSLELSKLNAAKSENAPRRGLIKLTPREGSIKK